MIKLKLFALIPVLLLSLNTQAATEDVFYTSGKIYVVTGVLALIIAILFVYLWRMDRRLKNLEKENEA